MTYDERTGRMARARDRTRRAKDAVSEARDALREIDMIDDMEMLGDMWNRLYDLNERILSNLKAYAGMTSEEGSAGSERRTGLMVPIEKVVYSAEAGAYIILVDNPEELAQELLDQANGRVSEQEGE